MDKVLLDKLIELEVTVNQICNQFNVMQDTIIQLGEKTANNELIKLDEIKNIETMFTEIKNINDKKKEDYIIARRLLEWCCNIAIQPNCEIIYLLDKQGNRYYKINRIRVKNCSLSNLSLTSFMQSKMKSESHPIETSFMQSKMKSEPQKTIEPKIESHPIDLFENHIAFINQISKMNAISNYISDLIYTNDNYKIVTQTKRGIKYGCQNEMLSSIQTMIDKHKYDDFNMVN